MKTLLIFENLYHYPPPPAYGEYTVLSCPSVTFSFLLNIDTQLAADRPPPRGKFDTTISWNYNI